MDIYAKPTLNHSTIERLSRLCADIDEEPALWRVYGEEIKDAVSSMGQALDYYQQRHIQNRGSLKAKGGSVSVRARQAQTRERLWREHPHVCTECQCALTWTIARVHHSHEIADGGNDDDQNVRLLCANCHAAKHARRSATQRKQELERAITREMTPEGEKC